MVRDKYGNYVVQKLIEFSDNYLKQSIIQRIVSSQALRKKDGFCKCLYLMILFKILAKYVIGFIEKMGLMYPQNMK
jgi:hypothetical protein